MLKEYIILTKVDDLATDGGTIREIRLSLQGQLENAGAISLLFNGLNITLIALKLLNICNLCICLCGSLQ